MNIKTHTIEIDHGELDFLGEGMILYLEEEMKSWKYNFSRVEDFCEDELDLLHSLCDSGFQIVFYTQTKKGKDVFGSHKYMTDAYEWAKLRCAQLKKEAEKNV